MSERRLGPATRRLLRAPSRLYDRGLGPLLGSRFLRLTHVGRHTGRTHHTVLEVVGRDRATGSVVVIAGLGRTADWYRNLRAGSAAGVEVGRSRFRARPRVLDQDEAAAVLADYERHNRWARPVVRWLLGRLAGHPYDGSPAARRELVDRRPLVALRPAPPAGDTRSPT